MSEQAIGDTQTKYQKLIESQGSKWPTQELLESMSPKELLRSYTSAVVTGTAHFLDDNTDLWLAWREVDRIIERHLLKLLGGEVEGE